MPNLFEAASARARRSFDSFFFTGFSHESLGLLRISFAAGLLLFHATQFYTFFELDPFGPHYSYLERVWYFAVLGLDVHVPWLSWAMCAVLVAATLAMAFGKWTRTAIAVLLLAVLYLQGARDSLTGDTHHRYLVPAHILFFLLLSRCGETLSLDARAKPAPRLEAWEASWPIKAAQLYTVSFYLWSLIAKLRVSGLDWFLAGGRLQELLLRRSVMWGLDADGAALGNPLAYWLAHQPELVMALSLSVLVLEGGFPLILWIRRPRWRLLFLLGATAFHAASFALLYVGFVLLPIAFLIFFDLRPVHGWLVARVRGRALQPASEPATETTS